MRSCVVFIYKFLLNLADFNFSPFLCWMVLTVSHLPSFPLQIIFESLSSLILRSFLFQCKTIADGSPSLNPWAAASHSGVALPTTPKHIFACILLLTAHWGLWREYSPERIESQASGTLIGPSYGTGFYWVPTMALAELCTFTTRIRWEEVGFQCALGIKRRKGSLECPPT